MVSTLQPFASIAARAYPRTRADFAVFEGLPAMVMMSFMCFLSTPAFICLPLHAAAFL